MKKTGLLLVICLMVSLLGTGCAHPLIDTWANRGVVGIQYGQQNILEFRDKMQGVLAGRKDMDVDALFRDILDVNEGRGVDKDGNPIELSKEWLDIQATALKFNIRLWEKDQKELDTATAKAIDNLDQVIETFEQIKRLRRAWGDWDAIQVQIDQLSGIVQQFSMDQQNND